MSRRVERQVSAMLWAFAAGATCCFGSAGRAVPVSGVLVNVTKLHGHGEVVNPPVTGADPRGMGLRRF